MRDRAATASASDCARLLDTPGRWVHRRSGHRLGCELGADAEMTRHRNAIGILLPLDMRVCAQTQALKSQSFSRVIWVETSHFCPPLP